MKAILTFLIFGFALQASAQIDITALPGNWCISKIVNTQDAEEQIPEVDLQEMIADMMGAVFHFTKDNRFTVIEEDMTLEDALKDALTFVHVKEEQILEMEDPETGELILFQLVKVSKTELVFRVYESVFGFEMTFVRCD